MIIIYNSYDADSKAFALTNSEGNTLLDWYNDPQEAEIYIAEKNPTFSSLPCVVDIDGTWKVVVNSAHEVGDLNQAIEDAKWDEVRKMRDEFLKDSDYTQVGDYNFSLTVEQQAEWETYRQTLRDIPQDYTNAEDVVFPDIPIVEESSSSSSSSSTI